MKVHPLKIWPAFYAAIEEGRKTFEVRRNDRDFEEGDLLLLMEWHPGEKQYTGRRLTRRVSFMTELWRVPGVDLVELDLDERLEERLRRRRVGDVSHEYVVMSMEPCPAPGPLPQEPVPTELLREKLKESGVFDYWARPLDEEHPLTFNAETLVQMSQDPELLERLSRAWVQDDDRRIEAQEIPVLRGTVRSLRVLLEDVARNLETCERSGQWLRAGREVIAVVRARLDRLPAEVPEDPQPGGEPEKEGEG